MLKSATLPLAGRGKRIPFQCRKLSGGGYWPIIFATSAVNFSLAYLFTFVIKPSRDLPRTITHDWEVKNRSYEKYVWSTVLPFPRLSRFPTHFFTLSFSACFSPPLNPSATAGSRKWSRSRTTRNTASCSMGSTRTPRPRPGAGGSTAVGPGRGSLPATSNVCISAL